MKTLKPNFRPPFILALFIPLYLISSGCYLFSIKSIDTVDNRALRGYDPVAYFTMNQAMAGKPEFSHKWKGAVWQFVSEEHKQSFQTNPEKYAPAYGGYCSYGMSWGFTFDGDPEAWTIYNNKLYLNNSPDVNQTWRTDKDNYIQDAEKHWGRYTRVDE